MLVLLPTDHNELLMQSKGPFEVSAVVVSMIIKCVSKAKRVYYVNLLKKYFEQEDSVPIGASAVEVNADIIKSRHVEIEDFLEIGGYITKESVKMLPSEITYLMSREPSL